MKFRQDMKIYIDNLTEADGEITHILSNIIDYVTQYRFQGGPEQPIRYLEMLVNKNDIDTAYPALIDSIVEGKTRLLIDAVDGGTFIITKIWLNGNAYELVATGIEVTLNTATLSEDDVSAINGTNLDPPKIVQTLFNRWRAGLNLTVSSEGYADDFQLYTSSSVSPSRTPSGKTISFKVGMPTLVAMNMCALMDDAFIFFANHNRVNSLYYVSYKDTKPLAYNPADDNKNGVVNIYPRMDSQYVNYTKFDLMMHNQLIGISSKNSEGSETIINKQRVSVDGSSATHTDSESTAMYGDCTGASVISDLIVTPYASEIAKNIVNRYKDPTRSITIELSEVKSNDSGSGWEEAIPTFSYAKKIVDNVNNITLTDVHLCDGEENEFILRLSTFIRAYPEMTTEYTFGVMKETTLSQELANKLTGMTGMVTDIRGTNGESLANDYGVVTIEAISKAMVDIWYPVGSIYISTNPTSPATIFGKGTWQSFGAGRTLVGIDPNDSAFDTVEETGGEKTHTLSTTEMPSHGHSVSINATDTNHTHSGTTDASDPAHSHGPGNLGFKSAGITSIFNQKDGSAPSGNLEYAGDSLRLKGSSWSGDDDTFRLSLGYNDANNVYRSGSTGSTSISHAHTFGTGWMNQNNSHGHSVNQSNAGGSGAHNNLQPYIVTYMWKRTA